MVFYAAASANGAAELSASLTNKPDMPESIDLVSESDMPDETVS
jgi:hypothetical protein